MIPVTLLQTILNLLLFLGKVFIEKWHFILIVSLLLTLTLTINGKRQVEKTLQESLQNIVDLKKQHEATLISIKEEQSKLEAKHKEFERDLTNEYHNSQKLKDKEIESLKINISYSNDVNSRLLDTINKNKQQHLNSTSEEQLRYINTLSRVYEESLRNGKETSELAEAMKIEFKQCVADIDAIYKSYNKYLNKENSKHGSQ